MIISKKTLNIIATNHAEIIFPDMRGGRRGFMQGFYMNAKISLSLRLFSIALIFLAFAAPTLLQATINDTSSINIGVLSVGSKDQCFDQWRPTAAYVSSSFPGYSVHIVCLDYDEVEKAVYEGRVDFTITNPAVYINLEYIFGATRIATLKGQGSGEQATQYGGVLFKKAERKDIETVADLKGKRFGAVDSMSFGGWLVGWRHLKQRGIAPFKDFETLSFLGRHDKVVFAVQNGTIDAGCVRTGVLEQMARAAEIKLEEFEVIDQQDDGDIYGIMSAQQENTIFPYMHSTQLYPNWTLAKVQHVDIKLAEQVMFAFLQIAPASKAALASHSNGWTIPLDYFPVLECLKELKVGPYKYLDHPITLHQLYQRYRFWVHGFAGLLVVILGGVFHVLILNRKLSFTMARLAKEQQAREKTVVDLVEFKTTLDRTSDCVFIFDPETLLFLYVNQGGLEHTGYLIEEMLRMNPVEIRTDITEQEFRTLIDPLLNHSIDLIEYTTNHKNKKGELVPVEVMLQHVTLPGGKGRCVAIVRNITRRLEERKERDQLQAKLLSEQKLASVGQLAAGIAHEINTPTQYLGSNISFISEAFKDIDTLITGYDQLLAAEEKVSVFSDGLLERIEELKDHVDWEYLQSEIPKALDQSQEGIAKISSIVLAMKEFSHPGCKEKQLTDINRLIETTVTVTSNEWKYVAEIDKQLDAQLPQILCLPNEIGQVFLNILVNAAHAITEHVGNGMEGEKGRITITTQALANQIEITFSDTGCGIPEDIGNKIFDPFFTTKEVGRGTGQGLTISYDAVVNKHGGTLDFNSTKGKGTTFIIRLPRSST